MTTSGWWGIETMDAEVGEASLNGGEEQGVTAWGRWAPRSWEHLVCAFLHLPQVHGPRLADWAKPTSGRIQSARSSLSLSFWPGHRSTCVYQLRTNIQLSSQEILPLLAKRPFILWGGTTWLKSPLPWQRPSVKYSWQCAPNALFNGLLIFITK